MNSNVFSQSPYRCKFDWGAIGAKRAAERGDVIVLVDVLSFSTTVVHAVSKGAVVFTCPESADARAIADREGAEIAVRRSEAPPKGQYSLSPLTFDNAKPGVKIVLPSLNGGTCVNICQNAPVVVVGALINASAVGAALRNATDPSESAVTIIACGERDKFPHNDLRMAIEDFLGAGAILAQLPFDKSPEAIVCEEAFKANITRIDSLLWECISGRELRGEGFADDVRFASRIDTHDRVPNLSNGCFR